LSRDPLGENGGENLYGFVYNSPIYYFDYLGGEAMNPNPKSSQELHNKVRDNFKKAAEGDYNGIRNGKKSIMD